MKQVVSVRLKYVTTIILKTIINLRGSPRDNVALELGMCVNGEELVDYLQSVFPSSLETLTSHAHFGIGS